MQAPSTTGEPTALDPVHVSGQLDRQHFACDMISQDKCPIDRGGSMRTQARESSGLGRRVHVVPGNVRIQQHMTKGRRRVPMLPNEYVGFD